MDISNHDLTLRISIGRSAAEIEVEFAQLSMTGIPLRTLITEATIERFCIEIALNPSGNKYLLRRSRSLPKLLKT